MAKNKGMAVASAFRGRISHQHVYNSLRQEEALYNRDIPKQHARDQPATHNPQNRIINDAATFDWHRWVSDAARNCYACTTLPSQ